VNRSVAKGGMGKAGIGVPTDGCFAPDLLPDTLRFLWRGLPLHDLCVTP
jgi:hypothetical protein